jgi:flagellar hook-length control protein FliK
VPDIAPALPIATAVQAPASGAGPLPAAPAEADPAVATFVGQLTAALKSLASAVSPLQTAPGRARTPAPQAPPAASAPPPAAPDAGPSAPDTDTDELPELLATLGFVVVPTQFQPVAATPADGPEGSGSVVHAASTPPAPRLDLPAAVADQPRAPAADRTAQAADLPTTQAPDLRTTQTADLPTTPLPTPPGDSVGPRPSRPARELPDLPGTAEASSVVPKTTADAPARPVGAREPRRPQSAPHDDAGAVPAAAPVIPEGMPARHGESAPPVATSTTTTAALVQPLSLPGRAPQPGAGGDTHDHRSGRSLAPVESASGDDAAPRVGSEPAFSASMAQVAAPGSAPAEVAAVQPSQVVSQIAHQAELYRLPGNRGVRIQLHPEDLGGVQVTVRYAAGGGLELHITVEHAATGALVQAGWTELRDALATQGIAPDRLVMSVTGPHTTASQADFSSAGGGSYRPDGGLAQFGQGGQSHGQRHDGADDARFARAWSARVDPTPATDDSPRVAISSAASRIDYRV